MYLNLSVAAAFFAITASLLSKVNNVQPTQYMDEVFHVNMTSRYYNGEFDYWDPLITTLPGLYYIGYAYCKLMNLVSQFINGNSFACNTVSLRYLSLITLVGIYFLCYGIIRQLKPKYNEIQCVIQSLLCCLFPTIYFYTFLYYTDHVSLLFILLSFYMALLSHAGQSYKYIILSFLTGFYAVFIRQTNIIWTCFIGGYIIFNKFNQDKSTTIPLVKQLTSFARNIKNNFTSCIIILFPYLFLCVLFLLFIYINGGIVLGDKSHHQFTIHLAQIIYYLLFSSLFLFENIIHSIINRKKSKFSKRTLLRWILYIVISSYLFYVYIYIPISIKLFITDNRHYTFYFYKNILKNYRYILILPASLCLYFYNKSLLSSLSSLLIMFFLLCSIIPLIMSPLLEVRYFTIPITFSLLFINYKQPPFRTLLLYICIDLLLLAIYIYKPFTWNDGSIARFMW
ncbi:hypothetical protein WA158_004135 [Blastocystis sp. Blastoise]